MRQLSVAAGTKMLLGAPARPMPRDKAEAIAALVGSIDGVLEAHLPHCFVLGAMESPAQVLVLLIAPDADRQAVLNRVGVGLSTIVPSDEHLDVWAIEPGNSMLLDIRQVGCRIFSITRRPWWKFW